MTVPISAMTVLQDSTPHRSAQHARGMAPAPTKPLSFARGTALYVAAVLGPGILTLPALAAHVAGPAFLLPLVMILVLSGLLAATFTSLGRRHGATSSLSAHVESAFGPTAGRVVGMLFYVGVPPGVAALGLFAGQYLQAATGGTHTPEITALVLILLTYRLNSAGLRASATAQLVLTSVLVLLLVVTVLLAAPHVDGARFAPVAPHGWAAVGPAAFLLVWVLTGWEASANLFGALDPGSPRGSPRPPWSRSLRRSWGSPSSSWACSAPTTPQPPRWPASSRSRSVPSGPPSRLGWPSS